jgi:signal transduction histidine kinase
LIGWSGVLLTAGGVFAFAGMPFAVLAVKRPNVEHRLTAALSFVCAATTLGMAFEAGVDLGGWRPGLPERLGLLLAVALALRLVLRHTIARTASVAYAIYAVVAGCAVLDSSNVVVLPFGPWVPLGLLAVVTGFSAKLAVEHVELGQKLDARRRELRSRTRKLMHSNHELRATQATLSTKEHLAAVGELAAVVAHEVRNPLAILSNAVASLRKESLAADDRATLLEIIDSEATRLNRIVTDLLRFSRPITLQRGTVEIGELVERALHLAAQKTGVRIDKQILAEGARVWADQSLLRQVIDNLIENAMQAMEAGGTLTVRVGTAGEGMVALEIVDTGEGMDTQVRARAKDPFFTTRPSGTGLGLAIVDRIVAAHGGHFEIDSRAGEGTKVTVHLPAASSEPPGSRASEPPDNEAPLGVRP